MLSRIYGSAARRRRRWYALRPAVRRRLDRPVISVGALAAGGSGKTPVAALVAGLLTAAGERPAVLSRGYARRRPHDGVVVVRDWQALRAGVDEAGDEPLMLARALPAAAVLVSEDRYLAGRFAETILGATVHVLDDGFQHLPLQRDVDLLLLSERDLEDPRTFPGGRLREPLEASRGVDAALVETPHPATARDVADCCGVERAFHFTRSILALRDAVSGARADLSPATPIVAVAGIARPQAFFDGLRRAGYALAAAAAFRDHYRYTAGDVASIGRLAVEHRAEHVVTTEKDLVRLLPHAPFRFSLLAAPLQVEIEPAAAFHAWLAEQVSRARELTR